MNTRIGFDLERGLPFIRRSPSAPLPEDADRQERCLTCGRKSECCCPGCGRECPASSAALGVLDRMMQQIREG